MSLVEAPARQKESSIEANGMSLLWQRPRSLLGSVSLQNLFFIFLRPGRTGLGDFSGFPAEFGLK